MRPRRVALLLLLTLLLVGTVFSTHAQSTNTLVVGIVTPDSLDPAVGSNDGDILIARSIHDYLVEVLPDRTIAPNLATDWKISDDGLTYTFNLVKGVKFSDGSDFSSADVVATFNHLKDVKSPSLSLLGSFDVSAPDANSVAFKLTQPNADFLYGVGDRFTGIEKAGDNLVGTGPFMVSENESDHLTLVKNPNYWQQGKPLLDSVKFVFIDDPVTQVNALSGGTVDFIYKVTPDQVSSLKGSSDITVVQKATNQHPVIRLRTDEGPGKDPNVRLAFKYATDRDQANQLVLDGTGVIGNNDPIGPDYGAFFDKDIQNPTYDPQKACDLLKQAGYPDGLSGITLQTINTLGYDTLATVLQQQWKKGCINVDINVNQESVYYADDNPNNWLKADLGITGWGDRPAPQQYLAQAYHTPTTDANQYGIYNETHWSDPDLDKLIEQAAVTTDQDKRADLYHQISQIFADSGPIIVPWFAPVYGAYNNKVQGLDMNPFPGLTDLRNVSIKSS